MATIQDVATQAGVSVATVSRVINESPRVSPDARARVLEAIGRLDYRPNLLGRNLRRTEARVVLVVLPSISNPFYARIVEGIEDVARVEGFNVLLCNTGDEAERERVYLGMLSQRLADGAILMAPSLRVDELELLCHAHPLVQCCEFHAGATVSHVSVDDRAAARDAVRYLLSLGHRRIALVASHGSLVSDHCRFDGYRDALAEADVPFDPELVAYGRYDFATGRACGDAFFALPPPRRPTAVFAISDLAALGVVQAARAAGLRVPEDVGVVGFDDIAFASMVDPPLTTIAQPQYDLGRTAAEILFRQLRDPAAPPEDRFLPHRLVIRRST